MVMNDNLTLLGSSSGKRGNRICRGLRKYDKVYREGLNHLIDNQCMLQLTNGFGTIMIPAEVLSLLD